MPGPKCCQDTPGPVIGKPKHKGEASRPPRSSQLPIASAPGTRFWRKSSPGAAFLREGGVLLVLSYEVLQHSAEKIGFPGDNDIKHTISGPNSLISQGPCPRQIAKEGDAWPKVLPGYTRTIDWQAEAQGRSKSPTQVKPAANCKCPRHPLLA